jgi:hypothetical protein
MTGWEDDDEVTTTYRSLRQGMQEAAILERERIIKLLEDYQQQALASHIVYLGLERAIKIIKGEYK